MIINFNLDASSHNSYNYNYNGHLVGYVTTSNINIDNVYEVGFVSGYYYSGIIGYSTNNTINVNLVAELHFDAYYYAGLLSASFYDNITGMIVQVDFTLDSFVDKAGIIGTTDNTVAIMTEIRGYTEYDSYMNYKYVGSFPYNGDITINGKKY